MKVVIFYQYFSFIHQPGISRIFHFVQEFLGRGHKVTVITGSWPVKHNKDGRLVFQRSGFHSRYHEGNLEVISFNDSFNQKDGPLLRMLSYGRFFILSAFYALTHARDADRVIASSSPLTIAIPAILLSRRIGKPFVFDVRDLWPDAPIQLGFLRNPLLIRLARLLELYSYRHASAICSVTERMSGKIERRSGKKILTIPNGVDEYFFREEETEGAGDSIEDTESLVNVIYAGSCGYNNAIETIFDLYDLVEEREELRGKTRFTIVGDGPALSGFKQKYKNRINMSGRIGKSEIAGLLRKADIALYPQRKIDGGNIKQDSLPNKFFDYIGTGLPILAAAVPDGEASRLLINENCGLVSEPEDPQGLYRNLKKLVENSSLRAEMSRNARQLSSRYRRSDQQRLFADMVESCRQNPF